MTTRREFLKHTSAASLVATTSCWMARAEPTAAPPQAAAARRAPGIVQTVLGPINASKLGFTLPHEHICLNRQGPAGRANAVEKAVERLKEARDAGISTVIDVTPHDVGRDVHFGAEVSRKSGMQIVACTGQRFFAPEDARSLERITELFVRDIEQGIDGTEIKAGVIKVAAGSGVMTSAEEKGFRAAARACKVTGVPITTHTNSPEHGGEKQAEIFEAEGLSPAWVTLGHSNDTDDMGYLTGLAACRTEAVS